MTIYYDNPAGRLHKVLKALKEVTPGSVPVRDAWARALGVPDPGLGTDVLVRRIVDVFQLPTKVELQMMLIDDEHFDSEFAMRWWRPVQNTFADTLFSTAQIAQILHYDDATLASLENCSYLLHRYRGEALPTAEDLASVRQLISEIEEIVAEDEDLGPQPGDVDPDLRAFLLRHAQAMRTAIDDFSFTGAAAMESVVDEALGAAIRQGYTPSEVGTESSGDDTESKAAIRSFWAMLSHAALILSMATNLVSIGTTVHSDATRPQAPPAIENVININDSSHSDHPQVKPGPHSEPEVGSATADKH